ncbi:MAG: transporter, family, chloramphenicol resistance protein, partial [Pseudonocardiales bacterium]|nr:transporter, family, chloramphenicol resistance protein [Pseudonocardiales bacterium]
MPRVVAVLALSIFVLGTSEFMITGLLPGMARDLGVSVPQTGFLISAFAIGMIVGAPLMAVLTLRLPRRTTLVAALLVFVIGHVLGALASAYAVVLVSRVVTALATATFWVVAAVVTVSVAGERLRARALAVLLSGLTISTVLGIPLGTFVGQQWGWRATFWAVAALALAGLVGVLLTVPPRDEGAAAPRLSDELAVFRHGRLWLALGTTALYQAGAISVFAYVSPLLTEVAGVQAAAVPVVLLGYGLGSLVGITIGGRLTDTHPWATLFAALGAGAVIFVALAMWADLPAVAIPLIVLLGFVAFLVAAPLNNRVFQLAGAAP